MLANAKMQISGPNVTRFRILLLARSAYHLPDSFATGLVGQASYELAVWPAKIIL